VAIARRQNKLAIPVFIKELGKYIKPENKFNKYVNIES